VAQEQNEAPRKLEGGWVGIEVSYWNLWELRRELREAKERLWHKKQVILDCTREPDLEL
jgi:hypothetical protein